jgi:hypothetical protein
MYVRVAIISVHKSNSCRPDLLEVQVAEPPHFLQTIEPACHNASSITKSFDKLTLLTFLN